MQVDQNDLKPFRNALGAFPTGVTIITAKGEDGALAGMTASSFNSVSMDPPLILWSITKGATYAPVFENASHFTVNVLAEDQQDLSNGFAKEGEKPFDGIAFETGLGGAPMFEGCSAQFQCETWALYDGGDHTIIVGKVIEFDTADKAPLVFASGGYRQLANS